MNGPQNEAQTLQFTLSRLDTTGNTATTDYRFPEKIMAWLSRRALPGSAYVRLDASCNGSSGNVVMTCYDEYDRCLADETFDLYEADFLLAARSSPAGI